MSQKRSSSIPQRLNNGGKYEGSNIVKHWQLLSALHNICCIYSLLKRVAMQLIYSGKYLLPRSQTLIGNSGLLFIQKPGVSECAKLEMMLTAISCNVLSCCINSYDGNKMHLLSLVLSHWFEVPCFLYFNCSFTQVHVHRHVYISRGELCFPWILYECKKHVKMYMWRYHSCVCR